MENSKNVKVAEKIERWIPLFSLNIYGVVVIEILIGSFKGNFDIK